MKIKIYEGGYIHFDEMIKDSLSDIQAKIEMAMGKEFSDYETAHIFEYNFIRRQSAQYYFSIKDKKWHRSKIKITSSMSWAGAVEPFRSIALWLLKKLGYQAKEKKKLDKMVEQMHGK